MEAPDCLIWTHRTEMSKLDIVWIVMGLSLDFTLKDPK